MIKQKLLKSNFINDMSRLKDTLSQTWRNIQGSLFPWLSKELGPLTEKQQELVTTLELNHPRQSRGLIIVSPSKGHIHEPPKGDHSSKN
jgi:hypothetical protein